MKQAHLFSAGSRRTTWTALVLLVVMVAAPLGALLPQEQPPCCCGEVCYMDCARDSRGADRHLEGEHDASAVWLQERPCAFERVALAASTALPSLEVGDGFGGFLLPKPTRRLTALCSGDISFGPITDSASPRGPPVFS